MKSFFSLIGSLLLILPSSVGAQSTSEQPMFPSGSYSQGQNNLPPLTAELVEHVLKSYRDLLAEFKDYKGSEDGSAFMGYLQQRNAVSKAETIIQKAGFKNWAEWSTGYGRVMSVYIAFKSKEVREEYAPQFQARLKEIENNPNIPEEQKKQAVAMIKASQGFLGVMANVNEQDLKVIAPYAAQFEEIINAEK